MKKLAIFAAGLAMIVGLAFGSIGATIASASGPDTEAEFGPRPWLRHAVVLAAAQTIGISVEQVQDGLARGLSLKEIGARHGDGPTELANGIIEHTRTILDNWVDDGFITREQAHHGTEFVRDHIRLIINDHFAPGPF